MRVAGLVPFLSLFAVPLLAQGITSPPPPPPPAVEAAMGTTPSNVVIVSGSGSVEMRPDLVSFSAGVSTQGADIHKILNENNAKAARIVRALKARGVKDSELRTSDFRLVAVDEEGRSTRSHKAGQPYEVSNVVAVTTARVADAGELVVAIVDAGANHVDGPAFSVSNEKAVQEQCIELAFGDARAKAQKLALLAGRGLGPVLAATDGSSSPFEFHYRTGGLKGGVVGGVSIEPGVHVVECGVTIAFQLK